MVPKNLHATSVSLRSVVQSVFGLAAPPLGGMVADTYGLLYVFYAIAVLLMIANVLTFLVPEVSKQEKAAE